MGAKKDGDRDVLQTYLRLLSCGQLGGGSGLGMAALTTCQAQTAAATGSSLWQRKGHIPPIPLLPYTRDLWRCGFGLAFPESQFGGLCWRRLWKGSLVRHEPLGAQAQKGTPSSEITSLYPQSPAPSLQLPATKSLPLVPFLLDWAQAGVTNVKRLSAHQLCGKRTKRAFPSCVCMCMGGLAVIIN